MRYEVQYLMAGEEHTEFVEAIDAADAASRVQSDHGQTAESFELLSVNLIEDHEHLPVPESGAEVLTTEAGD
jgi:hypothetical protein